MLFTSFDFAIFIPIVLIIYWCIPFRSLKIQNVFLVLISYFFYAYWDWRFLVLIVISTLIDYYLALKIHKSNNNNNRKNRLFFSVFLNIGILFVFKYYNFFIGSFTTAFTFFGTPLNIRYANIILPLGISFYTLQTLSYTIDVYKKKIKPTRSLIAYSGYVAFFPQLTAGPIEKASDLLPQFLVKRTFNYKDAKDGLKQILWGLFKKMVIADNCATYVNLIFDNPGEYSGSTLFLGVLLFTFQIYGDFSGYSDIAIGVSKLFGFKLTQNFKYPFFSVNMASFWRRWHISLFNWFKEYIYIPLGGNKPNKWFQLRNVVIVFLLSGLWHGANWTFIVWGLLHACLLIPVIFREKSYERESIIATKKISLKHILLISLTFLQVVLSFVFFRANNLHDAYIYYKGILSYSLFNIPLVELKALSNGLHFFYLIILIVVSFLFEWFQQNKTHPLQFNENKINTALRWTIYYGIIILIFIFKGHEQQFIYFQF